MTWLKLDDAIGGHEKIAPLGPLSFALHIKAMLYAARNLTDGFLPAPAARTLLDVSNVSTSSGDPDGRGSLTATTSTRRSPATVPELIGVLVEAGLWEVDEERGGYRIHDFLDYNPSREKVDEERSWSKRKAELHRDRELIEAIRSRDGSTCQYCGEQVDWTDRKSSKGGTYDHIHPRGPNALDNVVVACRGCNAAKGARTPEEAGIKLLSDPRSNPRPNPDLTGDPIEVQPPGPGPDPQRLERSPVL